MTARVTDGDTLRLGAVDIRLFGIDAPEARQMCARADGTPWPCGRAAADRLAELVAEGPVRCRPQDTDRYGRLVSICTAGGVDLGGRLVAEGLARAYARFSDAYPGSRPRPAPPASGSGRGAAEAPWEYRAETAPAGAEGFVPAAGAPSVAGLRDQGQHLRRRRAHLPPARRARLRPHPHRPRPRRGLVLRRGRRPRRRLPPPARRTLTASSAGSSPRPAAALPAPDRVCWSTR